MAKIAELFLRVEVGSVSADFGRASELVLLEQAGFSPVGRCPVLRSNKRERERDRKERRGKERRS